MEAFSALLAINAGNLPVPGAVPGEFPAQRPVTRTFDVFFDLRLNNAWVNNREAGDLRRYRAHNDVIVMKTTIPRPNGRAMDIFRELFGENRARYIGNALYFAGYL